MANKSIPKFRVISDKQDRSVQVRVQRIGNGFVVRTGCDQVFYPDIEAAADAIREGLIAVCWPITQETKS